MKTRYWIGLVVTGGIIAGLVGYKVYVSLDPDLTCAQCHEVTSACQLWKSSAHSDVRCVDCHGTALSGGIKGLAEKTGMIYSHFTKKQTNEDVSLNEEQVLAVADRCAVCNQAEQAAWESGAHSTTYKDIFMDVEHNRMEKPYWDCFRCHGMHYDGTIHDLMSLEGKVEDWHLKNASQADRPAMTCLACHQVHAEQPQNKPYVAKNEKERAVSLTDTRSPATALYMRSEKRHLPSDKLYRTTMFDKDSVVKVSDDPNAWLCMQCHAPNNRREVGSEDDKTPTGLYEGMSCLDCHNPHSNQLKNNYRNVHLKK